ncbi:MAG: signal peptidase I [Phycisphaerae bacterium]|nr:signal peptidase I [Phycisphaerae bacterium]
MTDTKKNEKKIERTKAYRIAESFESLITILIWALLLITFVIRSFIIPTGSMADTLMGAHFKIRCAQCGYYYDHGFDPRQYKLPENTVPAAKVPVFSTRCPSCGYIEPQGQTRQVAKGDKILTLKSIYQFTEPKRWDVVVFKNPREPKIDYIKRMIGKPGEKIEIIDGDVYINDKIARKPKKVQDELWMPIYDNDFQPIKPQWPSFNNHRWHQPFRNFGGSNWKVSDDNPTIFTLQSNTENLNKLFYDTSLGNDFRAVYAYNDIRRYGSRVFCSDLKIRYFANADGDSVFGAELGKYGRLYRATVDTNGTMAIVEVRGNSVEILEQKTVEVNFDKPVLIEFSNVDHLLTLRGGDEKLEHDFGLNVTDTGIIRSEIEPQAAIVGTGKLTVSRIAIFRDIHYTDAAGGPQNPNGVEGNPITLDDDQFFVLGDNSPNSADSRFWDTEGIANNGKTYPKGIVPREYLVGKALVVFWPSGYRPFERFPFCIVPDAGKMRFIYGGSNSR